MTSSINSSAVSATSGHKWRVWEWFHGMSESTMDEDFTADTLEECMEHVKGILSEHAEEFEDEGYPALDALETEIPQDNDEEEINCLYQLPSEDTKLNRVKLASVFQGYIPCSDGRGNTLPEKYPIRSGYVAWKIGTNPDEGDDEESSSDISDEE